MDVLHAGNTIRHVLGKELRVATLDRAGQSHLAVLHVHRYFRGVDRAVRKTIGYILANPLIRSLIPFGSPANVSELAAFLRAPSLADKGTAPVLAKPLPAIFKAASAATIAAEAAFLTERTLAGLTLAAKTAASAVTIAGEATFLTERTLAVTGLTLGAKTATARPIATLAVAAARLTEATLSIASATATITIAALPATAVATLSVAAGLPETALTIALLLPIGWSRTNLPRTTSATVSALLAIGVWAVVCTLSAGWTGRMTIGRTLGALRAIWAQLGTPISTAALLAARA